MAGADTTQQKDMIARGLHAIKRLPIARRNNQVTPPTSLQDLLKLLESYLVDKSHYAPPLKSLLFDAVQSLLPETVSLSTQWGKMDLCLVLKKWIISALRLSDYSMQNLLLVQIRRNPKNAKLMSHQVYLNPEGSEETLTFEMASPSPVKPTGAAASSATSDSPSIPPPSPVSALPDDFLAEVDILANDDSMIEFPTVFYTPGVPTLSPSLSAHGSHGTPDGPGMGSGGAHLFWG